MQAKSCAKGVLRPLWKPKRNAHQLRCSSSASALTVSYTHLIEEYVISGLSKKITNILETIKLLAFSDPFPIEQDCIHLQNGVDVYKRQCRRSANA